MNWSLYFIKMLDVVKLKSKDTSTQVAAIIVGPNKEIRSTGFNGFPRGVVDAITVVPERYERPAKYSWTEHAERNAIANAARIGISTDGCTIYQGWIPCQDCCRMIIQAGIKRIVIDGRTFDETNKYWNERWKDSMDVSKQMIREACIELLSCDADGNLENYFDKDK